MISVRSEVQVFLGPPIKGGLAQLGERLICIQEVSGSIPLSSTISPNIISYLFFNFVNMKLITDQNNFIID